MTTAVRHPTSTAPDQVLEAPTPKPSRAKVVFPVLVAVALVAGGGVWANGRGKEVTDDAQVEGHVVSIAPRVSGQVKKVLVKDNQVVKAGDVLVELDDRDYQVRLAAARADLAAAKAQLHAARTQASVTEKSADSNLVVARGGISQAAALDGTTRATIDQAVADVKAAESRRDLARIELDRSAKLLADHAIPQADFDTRKALFDQADAAVSQSRARLAAAQASLANSSGTIESARGRLLSAQTGPEQIDAAHAQVELAEARVDQAQAAMDQAQLNASYTQIKADADGVVARRSVEQGQLVSPDRPLMAIVPLEDTWVVANYKEDQLADMKPGQAAKVTIDTYGGRTFVGHVDSIAAGTGSRFSLLPPDNASGNFTKVVQRVPVLVRLDGPMDVPLRPGMSASVVVVTK